MFYSSTGERATRQDAKFLIRREIWPSTGSNHVGLVEGWYSFEITDSTIVSWTVFSEQITVSMQLRDYVR